MKNFPEVGRLISEAFEFLKQRRGQDLSVREAATKLTVSPAALSAWMHGQRAPRPKNISQMAKFFYGETAEQEQFSQALYEAIRIGGIESNDPLEAITSKKRGISVGIVEYDWFCKNPDIASDDGFLDQIFRRFLAFAAFPSHEVKWESLKLNEVVDSMTKNNLVDITLSYLATVDRALTLKFYTSPIRIGLNAVIHKDHHHKMNKIRDALSINSLSQRSSEVFPLIQEMEVGGIYITKTLRFDDPKTYRSIGYALTNYEGYAKALKDRRGTGAVPVAVADEYSCAQIIRAMKGDGEFVFPIHDITDSMSYQSLPSYALGLAVNRKHEKWVNYLNDALSLYLETDAEAISHQYFILWGRLFDEFVEILKLDNSPNNHEELAKKWVDRILGVEIDKDKSSSSRLGLLTGRHIAPWHAIIERTQRWINSRSGSSK